MKTKVQLGILLCMMLFLFSCEKKENEMTDTTLVNEHQDGFIIIDSSVVKHFPSAASIEIYFHFDQSLIAAPYEVERVVYKRNGTDGSLNPGNYSYIYNLVSTPLASDYNYEIALKFKNGLTSFPARLIVTP